MKKRGNIIMSGIDEILPRDLALQAGNSRRGYCFTIHMVAINMAITKERLINSGFYDLATAYQSVHVNY
ncbi:MAG: hypothetical protein HFH23_16095 [Ruminococcus sp.]|nr:hypothetical protein [Ruminococcus sp.]